VDVLKCTLKEQGLEPGSCLVKVNGKRIPACRATETHKWLTGCSNEHILKLPEGILKRGFVLEVLSLYIPDLFNKKHPLHSRIETVMRYAPLIEVIENFWLEATNREASSWTEHQDINMVMLATSLSPDGFLTI